MPAPAKKGKPAPEAQTPDISRIAELTAALASTKDDASRDAARLQAKLDEYKASAAVLRGMLARQARDLRCEADLREKQLRVELLKAKDELELAALRSSSVLALADTVPVLESERSALLSRLRESEADRNEAARLYLAESVALQARTQATKTKLETAYARALRSAVDTEQKRLASELDASAAGALAEVGGLRVILSQQSRELSRLNRLLEDAHQERDVLVSSAGVFLY